VLVAVSHETEQLPQVAIEVVEDSQPFVFGAVVLQSRYPPAHPV
jgi:hypothetical protein